MWPTPATSCSWAPAMAERKPLRLEDLPDLLTLREASVATGFTVATLRTAIKNGELEAFIPRGREPLRAGPGQGYRITREALTRYYFRQS